MVTSVQSDSEPGDYIYDFIKGSGTGKPLGIINKPGPTFFEVAEAPVEVDFPDLYRKNRHGIDTKYHVMLIEHDDEEVLLSFEHPSACSDETDCWTDELTIEEIPDDVEVGTQYFVNYECHSYTSMDSIGPEYDCKLVVIQKVRDWTPPNLTP